MKTKDLITMLSTNVEVVDRRQMPRTLGLGTGLGFVAALGSGLIALGCRPDAGSVHVLGFIVIKLIFAITIAALAVVFLTKAARPGGIQSGSMMILLLPFAVIFGLAVIAIADAPGSHWHTVLMGDEWLECLASVPIIAILPFALVVWAVRQAAPTRLRQAGALAGLVAGGLSAASYALHCTADSLSFIAVWYGGTIILCAVVGWAFGPRLLRW